MANNTNTTSLVEVSNAKRLFILFLAFVMAFSLMGTTLSSAYASTVSKGLYLPDDELGGDAGTEDDTPLGDVPEGTDPAADSDSEGAAADLTMQIMATPLTDTIVLDSGTTPSLLADGCEFDYVGGRATLTLTDFNQDVTDKDGIVAEVPLTIILQGTNTITVHNVTSPSSVFGIFLDPLCTDFVITGEGTLNIIGDSDDLDIQPIAGIYGSATININNVILNITGASNCIRNYGDISIDKATITSSGVMGTDFNSDGIFSLGNVEISNSVVNASGNWALTAYKNMSFSNSNVTATGVLAGISAGYLSVSNNSTVVATANDALGVGIALGNPHSKETRGMTVSSGSTITAEGSMAAIAFVSGNPESLNINPFELADGATILVGGKPTSTFVTTQEESPTTFYVWSFATGTLTAELIPVGEGSYDIILTGASQRVVIGPPTMPATGDNVLLLGLVALAVVAVAAGVLTIRRRMVASSCL